MPTVTLLEKVYGSFFVKLFEPSFSSLYEGLKVQVKIVGKTDNNWIKVEVSGEDEAVALRLLEQKSGFAPTSIDEVKKFSVLKGRIVVSKRNQENRLLVDFGFSSPHLRGAFVPFHTLKAQIANGKDLSFGQLIDSFCLYENLPIEIKIVNSTEHDGGWIEAEFSEEQLQQFEQWLKDYVDRLIILGAPRSHVENAVEESKHFRDVIRIDSLGLLEHVIVCKLGTDAVGLIPKLGKLLSPAQLASFSPPRIQQ